MAHVHYPSNIRDEEKTAEATPAVARSADHLVDEDTKQDNESVLEKPSKWSMGILNDSETNEVPGSVLLLTGNRNQPLGLKNAPRRTSNSSLPTLSSIRAQAAAAHRAAKQSRHSEGKKLTKNGQIILEPQPDDSHNDPLNWPNLKRDVALLSLGIFCMVGGGMTPVLAAGFTDVAATYHIATARVSLSTGLYMMGLGVGSVIASPTAILFGKRPVYLVGAIMFVVTSIWCATSPSFTSLLVARVFQGMSISPVECLPSATIAEIFFLHERAFRIGIYTLLLLGGKNIVPLVSAAIVQGLSWRWVFWICSFVGCFCWVLLFLFVPETFWDRSPAPKTSNRPVPDTVFSSDVPVEQSKQFKPIPENSLAQEGDGKYDEKDPAAEFSSQRPSNIQIPAQLRVGAAAGASSEGEAASLSPNTEPPKPISSVNDAAFSHPTANPALHDYQDLVEPQGGAPPTPLLHTVNSPFYNDVQRKQSGFFGGGQNESGRPSNEALHSNENTEVNAEPHSRSSSSVESVDYTTERRDGPRVSFVQTLKPFNGRLNSDNWLRVAIRPFILFAYPAVLWSAIVYACSVGWLIVLSESVAIVYRSPKTYNFSALSTGLIYISPFIGGVLGTAVAGKVSDIIVQAMSKRNGGLYEPEFRLVMAAPIAITTVIGLMGFGWSAYEKDKWIVPTIFFGVISFGCSLGSTTAITFCVDSYRQYAGEALVTLNFSKNIFHGLVFSLFFSSWLTKDGSKKVFIWVGVIQLILMCLSVPMYIFGKRARMWTVRKNFMEMF